MNAGARFDTGTAPPPPLSPYRAVSRPVDLVGAGARSGPPKRISVAFCIDNMGIGGTELNALRTAERLDRTRFDVHVICLRSHGPLAERYRRAGIPVHDFPIPSLYAPATLRQGLRLARFFARQRIDVVHSHDMYDNVFASAFARLARVPVVIASRRWSHVLPERRHRVANAIAYRFVDRVVANSPAVVESLVSADRVPRGRIAMVSNFVDEAAFTSMPPASRATARTALGVPEGGSVVGIVARLGAVKDHATLLRAMAELVPAWPAVHLVIVGDGECRAELEALTAALGIQAQVHFAGIRDNEPNLHHLFDISVLCSRSEGFPNSIVEAMAAARPVVATAVGGNVDAVSAGETGLLVPPADPRALSAAIGSLLRDPARGRAMGVEGARRARARYHAGEVVRALEELYEELVGAAVRGRRVHRGEGQA